MPDQTRFAWAKLNADTVFIALLAIISGGFDLLDPARDAVTAARDEVYILHWIRAGSYVLSGALLILALLRSSVSLEAVARGVLIGGLTLNAYRHAYWLGWDETETLKQTAVLIALVAITHLRLSVLLNRGGLVITRPAEGGE